MSACIFNASSNHRKEERKCAAFLLQPPCSSSAPGRWPTEFQEIQALALTLRGISTGFCLFKVHWEREWALIKKRRKQKKKKEKKMVHHMGHLPDLCWCDSLWLQLTPGGGFPLDVWSLSLGLLLRSVSLTHREMEMAGLTKDRNRLYFWACPSLP